MMSNFAIGLGMFMGYRGQSGFRRGSGEKFQKSRHEKTKSKSPKSKPGLKYAPEEMPIQTSEEVAQKTLISLNQLGIQNFALSPFRQYYDDWLVNLRQVISEFESNPIIDTDEAFKIECTQIFADVEGDLAKMRIRESELEDLARILAENNHLLVEIDATYASQVKELGVKRNGEIQQLAKIVHDLEEEIVKTGQLKTSFFGFTKKAKAQKESELIQKKDAAKKELELAIQNFAVEQDKLHDEYQKKKQETIENVRRLESEVANIEIDVSKEARQTATTALASAIKMLLQRKTTVHQ